MIPAALSTLVMLALETEDCMSVVRPALHTRCHACLRGADIKCRARNDTAVFRDTEAGWQGAQPRAEICRRVRLRHRSANRTSPHAHIRNA
jgi:hypothetical protein